MRALLLPLNAIRHLKEGLCDVDFRPPAGRDHTPKEARTMTCVDEPKKECEGAAESDAAAEQAQPEAQAEGECQGTCEKAEQPAAQPTEEAAA